MDKYLMSVDKCINWIESQMLSFDRGRVGIYERIRIDMHRRVSWTRPDCNSEMARVYLKRNRPESQDILEHITDWVLSVQDNDPLSCWYGSFPFYLNDGEYANPNCKCIWGNDNGKVLIALLDIYKMTGEEKYKEAALRLASFWLKVQKEEGFYYQQDGRMSTSYKGPCFVFWMAAGMAMCYGVTGDEKYAQSVRRAMNYVLPLQKESGRFTTTYELAKREDWRPASSEASLAVFCLARILKYMPDDSYRAAFDKVAAYVLSLQHESGGIINSDEEGASASLQDDRMRCDLVYTEGFALIGLNEAYALTKDEKYKQAAIRLADFLVSIQCENENPLWDGAWRGAYNPVTKRWEGRANQNNDIDEGGMYSVYTGWCCTNIMDGLIGVSKMLAE